MNRDTNDMRTGGWYRISSCLTDNEILDEELRPWLYALNNIRVVRPDFFRELIARLLCDNYNALDRAHYNLIMNL